MKIHYQVGNTKSGMTRAACGAINQPMHATNPKQVTCKSCRRSELFKKALRRRTK